MYLEMSTLELRVYEIFKNKLGEKEAETVLEYFESKTEEKILLKKMFSLQKITKLILYVPFILQIFYN